jgi:CysZ protein
LRFLATGIIQVLNKLNRCTQGILHHFYQYQAGKQMNNVVSRQQLPPWVPLTSSLFFILTRPKILGWSILLVGVTCILTWGGYVAAIDFIQHLTGNFFLSPPERSGIIGWFIVKGWVGLQFLFSLVSRIVSFYLAFLLAYCLTSPGYVFLSTATERITLGGSFEPEQGLSVKGMVIDLLEGCKIGALGLGVTMLALLINFIPFVGQALVLLIYTYYSALMFVDYPASRTRWSLGKKIQWVRRYYKRSFRLGIFPALVSLVPVINIFFMALLFPLFTVHTTLNFTALERPAETSLRESTP